MVYDVAVIGGGVIGSLIARELSKYELDICLLEKEADVGTGTSSANSGIVHAGYDAEPGSLMARLNVRGNNMMEQVAKDLDIPFKRIGSLVLASNEGDKEEIRKLLNRGMKNGVADLEIISKERLKAMEPNVSADVEEALYAPTAGIICPYQLTMAAAENAVLNGVTLKLEFHVADIRQENGYFLLDSKNDSVQCRYVVNAAGLFADTISSMVSDEDFSIGPRKGEYLLLDKNQGNVVNSVIFQTPSKAGKGILVSPTVDGNLLIGPNAQDMEDKEDRATSMSGLQEVIDGAKRSVSSINTREVITSFSGIRAIPSTGDFIIEISSKSKGFINVAGIASPGLSAAPAIAEYVADLLSWEGLHLLKKKNFNPKRKPVYRFNEMSDIEREAVIKENPRYGRIVCRCESVTEGEIADCINRPAGARNLDGVKRRTRAGMGRCQSGFCTPRVVEILSRELGIPLEEVTKMGGNSKILFGKTK